MYFSEQAIHEGGFVTNYDTIKKIHYAFILVITLGFCQIDKCFDRLSHNHR